MRLASETRTALLAVQPAEADGIDCSKPARRSDNRYVTLATAPIVTSAAAAQAARNWTANLRALAIAQPQVVDAVQALPVHGEWVLARDGVLTLLDHTDRWLGGCSLPYRAAQAMLKSFEPRGTLAGFLAPGHAAEIRAALDRLSHEQAVLILQPDLQTLRVMLSCGDFSADLAAHRVYFVTGNFWSDDLQELFVRHPGLPTPQQFIKLPTAEADVVDPLIAESQKIFNAVITERAERIRTLRDTPRSRALRLRQLGVIAGTQFKLWDDAGTALAEALCSASPDDGFTVTRLDPDVPIFAGPLATAEFCRTCDAIVTADTARCDFPDVLPLDLPWVTWVTKGRIPAHASAGVNDALLLADAAWTPTAVGAGWPADRVRVAAHPLLIPVAQPSAAVYEGWTVIADTVPIETPGVLEDFSSHRLMWEAIAAELAANPFALGEDLNDFLYRHARRQGVDVASIDRRLFIETLIVPAYMQGIVRQLLKHAVPVRTLGRGWDQMDEFSAIARGPVSNRAMLAEAAATSTRLVHVWPLLHAHPIDAIGLPVLRRTVSRIEAFVQQARQPSPPRGVVPSANALTIGTIREALRPIFQLPSNG